MKSGADRLAEILATKRQEAAAIESMKGEFRRQALLRNDFRGFRWRRPSCMRQGGRERFRF
jgi:hypothetical protein